jgi:hypothetical protein
MSTHPADVSALECDRAGVTPLVPKPMTSNSKAESPFDKADFIYTADDDEYLCPAVSVQSGA